MEFIDIYISSLCYVKAINNNFPLSWKNAINLNKDIPGKCQIRCQVNTSCIRCMMSFLCLWYVWLFVSVLYVASLPRCFVACVLNYRFTLILTRLGPCNVAAVLVSFDKHVRLVTCDNFQRNIFEWTKKLHILLEHKCIKSLTNAIHNDSNWSILPCPTILACTGTLVGDRTHNWWKLEIPISQYTCV